VKNLVAKLEVVGVRRDGRWACSIAIAPLAKQPDDVRGTDSFHAVWLACALVLRLLENLKTEGWGLENRDGSEFPLEAYRSGLGPPPQ
jgi:hypothetical protein